LELSFLFLFQVIRNFGIFESGILDTTCCPLHSPFPPSVIDWLLSRVRLSLIFVFHIFPIIISLTSAIADIKAKLIYSSQGAIFTPSLILVVNRYKADNILRHISFSVFTTYRSTWGICSWRHRSGVRTVTNNRKIFFHVHLSAFILLGTRSCALAGFRYKEQDNFGQNHAVV
jgi:hypothetical protein